jgi:hypothetical protein
MASWPWDAPQWAQNMHAETLRHFARIETQLSRIEKTTMAAQEDLDALVTEISTATAAIVAEIDALDAKIAAGETVDLTGLRAAVTALDAVAVPLAPPVA